MSLSSCYQFHATILEAEKGTACLTLGAWSLTLGVWSLDFDAWTLGFDAWMTMDVVIH